VHRSPEPVRPITRVLLAALAAAMLTAAACSPDRDMPSPGTGPSTSRISQSSRGRLKATPDRRDVGSVSQLRSVEATYGILNAGDEAVRILNVVCT
jgi:hypothetical protein